MAVRGGLSHEAELCLELGVVVAVRRGVVCPGGLRAAGRHPPDDFLQAGDVPGDQPLVEAGFGQRAPDVPRTARIAPLQRVLRDDVHEDAGPRQIARREQRPQRMRGNPIDIAAQPRSEIDALVGLHHQGIEEQLAELPVADPRLPPAQQLEGRDVDEDRLRAAPLDVVGGGVLQDHAGAERRLEEIEVQQRGVLQHAEGPFVGIGDERDPGMLEHGGPIAAELRFEFALGPGGLDDAAQRGQLAKEGSGAQALPVRQRLRADAAKDPAVPIENSAVAVPVGARLELQGIAGSVMPVRGLLRRGDGFGLLRDRRARRGGLP